MIKIKVGLSPSKISFLFASMIGEHPCRNVVSIKLQSNFTETTLRHVVKNTSGRLLLKSLRFTSQHKIQIFLLPIKPDLVLRTINSYVILVEANLIE